MLEAREERRSKLVLAGSMTFDEGAEHGVDFFGFFDPEHADFLFDETGFNSDVDLSDYFATRPFGDRHESRHFRTTVAFTTF